MEPRSLYEYDALYRLITASGRENAYLLATQRGELVNNRAIGMARELLRRSGRRLGLQRRILVGL